MLRPGQVIIICVVALLTLGVVMVNSAGMTVDPKTPVTIQSILLSRSTIYMGLALLAMGVVSYLAPLRLLEIAAARPSTFGSSPGSSLNSGRSGWPLRTLWIGVGLMLAVMVIVYIPGIGSAHKGSHRWINLALPGLGDLSVQPSEFAKWGLVVLMAWYATVMGGSLGRFMTGLLPALVALGIVAGFVVLEDLGTGILVSLVAVTILIAGGARLWHFLLMLPIGLLAFAAAVIQHPYRLERLTTFVNPYKDPQGAGYHMIQSMLSVANGEFFGRGLGHGLQKFGYLPEDTTDFLFAVVCEELGVFGALVVVTLYIGILWSGWLVIRRQTSPILKLVALGVVATVGIQAIINLAVVTGLGPTKGIALPLLSSGGTGWILTAASLGLLVAMDRVAEREEMATPAPLPSSLPLPPTSMPSAM